MSSVCLAWWPSAEAFGLVSREERGQALCCLSELYTPDDLQVSDMLEAGHQPDTFTYAALLSACQRAEEAELAFDILK